MPERSCPHGGRAPIGWRIAAAVAAVVVAVASAGLVADAMPAAIIGFAGAAVLAASGLSGRCAASLLECGRARTATSASPGTMMDAAGDATKENRREYV